MLTQEQIQLVKKADLETLVYLDQIGLIIAPHETMDDFAKRLEKLRTNLDDFHKQTTSSEFYCIENLKFKSANLIEIEHFSQARKKTAELYDFEIDWVPGFYQNPTFSWLFGGCCYTSHPDFFSLFQIKEKMRHKPNGSLYSRTEIMSHEMCHVARSGMKSVRYEEFFAYQTSDKMLRKALGSILYSQYDSFVFILASLFLPLFQVLNTFFTWNLPNYLPAVAFFLIILFYAKRFYKLMRTFKKAYNNLSHIFLDKSMAVLFRCDDKEIENFAKLKPLELMECLKNLKKCKMRWQVIFQRFKPSAPREN